MPKVPPTDDDAAAPGDAANVPPLGGTPGKAAPAALKPAAARKPVPDLPPHDDEDEEDEDDDQQDHEFWCSECHDLSTSLQTASDG